MTHMQVEKVSLKYLQENIVMAAITRRVSQIDKIAIEQKQQIQTK